MEEEQTLSSGDVMVLKEEEVKEEEVEEGVEDSQDAQVTLHLHPVPPHRPNDDITTTVLAIQARCGSRGSAHAEDVEYGYPITCGDSRAVLLFKKFVCPGINVRCVMFQQQLISPKQFVQLSGKASLKDWKRAIRLGGVMLRKMMHCGQIDFYRHAALCTSTCRSTRFDAGVSPGPAGPPHSTADPRGPGGAGQPGPQQGGDVVKGPHRPGDQKSTATSGLRSGLPRPGTRTPPQDEPIRRKRPRSPDGVWSLWRSVADSGLLGEVLSSIQTQLEAALSGLDLRLTQARLQAGDAAVLHTLCEALGLLDGVEGALEHRLAETYRRGLDRRHGDRPGQRGLNTGDHLAPNALCGEAEFGSDLETADQRRRSEDAVADGTKCPRRTPGQPRPTHRRVSLPPPHGSPLASPRRGGGRAGRPGDSSHATSGGGGGEGIKLRQEASEPLTLRPSDHPP